MGTTLNLQLTNRCGVSNGSIVSNVAVQATWKPAALKVLNPSISDQKTRPVVPALIATQVPWACILEPLD